MNPSNQQQELREAIGRIVYRVHTDGRLQGKVAQDAVKWKSEVMDPIDEIGKLVHSHMQAVKKEMSKEVDELQTYLLAGGSTEKLVMLDDVKWVLKGEL